MSDFCDVLVCCVCVTGSRVVNSIRKPVWTKQNKTWPKKHVSLGFLFLKLPPLCLWKDLIFVHLAVSFAFLISETSL